MFDGYAGAVYDALVERGKLRATEETKAKAREQARKELRSEYIRKRGGLAAHIGAGLDFGNNETLRTKRILLELYFRRYLETSLLMQNEFCQKVLSLVRFSCFLRF